MLGFGPWGTAPTIWLNCQGKRFMNEGMSGLALVQSLHQPMPELGKTANFAVMDANYMKYIQLAGLDHGAPNWGYQEGMDLFESDMQALDPAVGNCMGQRFGNAYSCPSAGNNMGNALTTGRVAGKHAAAL